MLRVLRSLQRKAFNYAYLFTPPWDLAVPAPEIVRFVSERTPGKAIDVGCGTGTNLLYLAQHNWTVTVIDFALLAIKKADRKLKDYSRTLTRCRCCKTV